MTVQRLGDVTFQRLGYLAPCSHHETTKNTMNTKTLRSSWQKAFVIFVNLRDFVINGVESGLSLQSTAPTPEPLS